MGASGFSRNKIKEPGRSLYIGRDMSKTEQEKEKLVRGLHTSLVSNLRLMSVGSFWAETCGFKSGHH